MIKRAMFGAAAAAVMLAGAAGQAAANDLPLSSGDTSCVDGATGTVTGGDGVPCTNAGAKAFFSPAPFPAVEASAATAGPFSEGASAGLVYDFEILGPNNGPIKIDISADLLTGGDSGFSFARVLSSGGATACADTNEGVCAGPQFHGTISEFDTPGTVYQITLQADATANGAFPGSQMASADPLIFVDLGDLNAGAYSIEVSPDTINAEGPGGVPEPASWALMILGFGAAGAAMRRRALASTV